MALLPLPKFCQHCGVFMYTSHVSSHALSHDRQPQQSRAPSPVTRVSDLQDNLCGSVQFQITAHPSNYILQNDGKASKLSQPREPRGISGSKWLVQSRENPCRTSANSYKTLFSLLYLNASACQNHVHSMCRSSPEGLFNQADCSTRPLAITAQRKQPRKGCPTSDGQTGHTNSPGHTLRGRN